MGRMWMGTRGYERWVPDCAINPDFTRQGASATTTFLGGGRKVVRSRSGSKSYQMTWNMKHRDDVRFISDLAEGLYDAFDGVNLVYFLDPMAMDRNVLSQMHASPMQAAIDGIPWISRKEPKLVPTGSSSLGYPARSAVYSLKDTDVSSKVYIPIPPGYSAWVGVHGQQDDACVRVATVSSAGNASSPKKLEILSIDDPLRFNSQFSASESVIGIELDIGTTPAISKVFEWRGAADDSPSDAIEEGRLIATNWVRNPRMLTTSGTVQTSSGPKPAVKGIIATNAVAWQDSLHAGASGKSLKIEWPSDPSVVGFGTSTFGTSPFGGI